MLRYVTLRHVTLRYVLYYALSIRCVATCAKRWGCEEAVPLRTSVCPHVGCLGGYRIHAICRRHTQLEFQLLDLVSLRWLGEWISMRINKVHGERLGTLATTISERKGTEQIGTDRNGSKDRP